MTECVTWKWLDEQQATQCIDAVNISAIRVVLKGVDHDRNFQFLYSDVRVAAQVSVLLDLYGHAILFGKATQLTTFKISTFIGILREVHEYSMSHRLSRVESYDYLRQLIIRHSVHRPPYSAMIFDLREVQEIDTYLMSTYYRHYKMYVYCFVPQEVAKLYTVGVRDVAEAPPTNLPALAAAITEEEWKRKIEEVSRKEEENEMEEELRFSEEVTEDQQRMGTLDNPNFSEGIREQLEVIKEAVAHRSTNRLEQIEEKLTALETKVSELAHNRSRPGSRSIQKRKK